MRIIAYRDLQSGKYAKPLERLRAALKRDDFAAAGLKKLAPTPAAFAKAHIAALFEHLGPATLDVQTDRRLVRLERGQAEFWVLALMLAGIKTHAGGLGYRQIDAVRYARGFFADNLLETLERLPEHLWPKSRRKRDYVSSVLARAEIDSTYRPARKLWRRRELGYYVPSPGMFLKRKTAEGETWTPITEALNLAALREGAGGGYFDVYPLEAVEAEPTAQRSAAR